MTKFHTIIIVY